MSTFTVLTIFPEIIEASLKEGVVGRAFSKGLLKLNTIQIRDYAKQDVHKAVDDRPYGGGDGMVMMTEPLAKAFDNIKANVTPNQRIIYLSPQGQRLSQTKAKELAQYEHLVILSGRYAGVDERVLNEFVDEEISIGDYVLSGGELAAAVVIDVVARFIPGVLGHHDSVENDSLSGDGLLEAPLFTRPREFLGISVPDVLMSGDHKKIENWRRLVSVYRTFIKRPDLWSELIVKNQSLVNELEVAKKYIADLSAQERTACGIEPEVNP